MLQHNSSLKGTRGHDTTYLVGRLAGASVLSDLPDPGQPCPVLSPFSNGSVEGVRCSKASTRLPNALPSSLCPPPAFPPAVLKYVAIRGVKEQEETCTDLVVLLWSIAGPSRTCDGS